MNTDTYTARIEGYKDACRTMAHSSNPLERDTARAWLNSTAGKVAAKLAEKENDAAIVKRILQDCGVLQ